MNTHTSKIWILIKYNGVVIGLWLSHKPLYYKKNPKKTNKQKTLKVFKRSKIYETAFSIFRISCYKKESSKQKGEITGKIFSCKFFTFPHNPSLSPEAASDACEDTSQWFLPRGADNTCCKPSFCSLPQHVGSRCHSHTPMFEWLPLSPTLSSLKLTFWRRGDRDWGPDKIWTKLVRVNFDSTRCLSTLVCSVLQWKWNQQWEFWHFEGPTVFRILTCIPCYLHTHI